jgi:hypothetical protein
LFELKRSCWINGSDVERNKRKEFVKSFKKIFSQKRRENCDKRKYKSCGHEIKFKNIKKNHRKGLCEILKKQFLLHFPTIELLNRPSNLLQHFIPHSLAIKAHKNAREKVPSSMCVRKPSLSIHNLNR